MANQKEYRIVINGVSESISQIDSLISKIDSLSKKIDNLNKNGISVNTSVGSVDTSSMQEVAQAQKQITVEIQKQTEALSEQKSFVDSTKQAESEVLQIATQILGAYDSNVAKLDELNQAIQRNKENQKEVAKQLKDELITSEQAATMRQRLLDEELKLKAARSEVNAVLKNEVKMNQANADSYDKMSQTLGRLKDALRASGSGLSPENFEKISRAIDAMDAELKSADKSIGNFFREVGNYASAADGFQKITLSIGGMNKEFDSARSAVAELKNGMTVLAAAGQRGSEAYEELKQQMHDLQLAIQAVNDDINETKEASSGLHSAVEAIQGLVAIGSIGQGFSSLFGIDNGALGEQIKKLTSLMAIMQGLQQLSTQIATGTGIGSALKKVLDVSGLNNDWKQLKESMTVLGQKLGIVKTQSVAAAGGMTAFAAATRAAEAAVKGLGKALLIGVAIEAVMFVIDGLVEGIKWLYNVAHDWISLSDDVKRANDAAADSFERMKDNIEGFNAAREREASSGLIDEYQKEADILENTTKELQKQVELFKIRASLNAKNAGIYAPELANWKELTKVLDNVELSLASGNKWVSGWNDIVKKGLSDVIARINELDKTDMEAIKNFLRWANESPQVGQMIRWALEHGDEGAKMLAQDLLDSFDTLGGIADRADIAANKLNAMNKALRDELELRQKYGNNWRTEKQVLDSNSEVENSGLLFTEQAKLKQLREQEIRERNTHNKKITSGAKKTSNELLQLEKMLHEDKLAVMRDGLRKTLAIIEEERRARLENINKSNVSESKKQEARVAANARYDKAALDARKNFLENYEEQEASFTRKMEQIHNDYEQKLLEYNKDLSEQTYEDTRTAGQTDFFKTIFGDWYDDLKNINKEYDELDKKIRSIENSGILEERKKTGGYDQEFKEYIEAKQRIVELQEEMSQINTTDILSMDSDSKLNTWPKTVEMIDALFKDLSNLEQKSIREMQIANEEAINAADARIQAVFDETLELKKQAEKQWEVLKDDEEAVRVHYLTQSEIEEYALKSEQEQQQITQDLMLQARQDYLDRIKSINQQASDRIVQIEKERDLAIRKNFQKQVNESMEISSRWHSGRLAMMEESTSTLEKKMSAFEKKYTNQWGILDFSKYRDANKRVLGEIEAEIEKVKYSIAGLLSNSSNGMMSVEDFRVYTQLSELLQRLEEDAREAGDAAKDFGKSWKGIDEWIQQIASSFQGVLSAIFEYQNGEFDRMQEAIDKELEIVQNKYDEMEEMAQKHKDAMNEIEDELSTARGDRRQHLIDALSSEIQAQREALAKQKQYEKQKEALEKKSDALELDRKKAQRKQDIIQAILNGALAVSQAATNHWPVPAIPLMALAAAATAAQVAIMSATHYREGGLLHGADHEHGGIKLLGGQAEAEGGEFIINKKTTSKNLPLIDFVNSSKRKLNLDDFIDFYSGEKKGKRLFGVNGKYASGGLLPSVDLAERLVNVVVERDKAPIYVSVVDINRAQSRVATVEQLAGKY